MYVEREIEKEIKKYMHRKEIVAVVGPRQAGKTTLINHILEGKPRVKKVSFDDVRAKELFERNPEAFKEMHVKDYDYLFIDEIQYSKEAGKNLKYIYDTSNIKIFISGSSANEMAIGSLKHLVGRVFLYTLYPFSFTEFLEYKNKKMKEVLSKGSITGLEEDYIKLLREYLLYGGYPAVVLAGDREEKELILKNIYSTFILREIKDVFGIMDDYKVARLVKALALQTGNIISYSELANTCESTAYEVKKHLNVLEKSFICMQSRNFHTNKRTELKKSPKVFFYDTGLRNSVLGIFSEERTDYGQLYENFVAEEISKKGYEVKYWRTQSKAEVDFVLEKKGEITPIEVKTAIARETVGKSMISFIEKYNPKRAYILSEKYEGKRRVAASEVIFAPMVKLPVILG